MVQDKDRLIASLNEQIDRREAQQLEIFGELSSDI